MDSKKEDDALWNFFKDIVVPRINKIEECRILELGAGDQSSFDGRNWNEIGGQPYSIVALDKKYKSLTISQDLVGELPPIPDPLLNYIPGDITQKISGAPYDLVFDSHCIHCLISKEERQKAWHNLYHSLKEGGIVAGEMMAAHKFMQFNLPFFYHEEEKVLFKVFGDKLVPLRKILNHLEIEEEILSAGFQIEYFFFAKGRKFSFDEDYQYAWKTDPDCLLYVARKN